MAALKYFALLLLCAVSIEGQAVQCPFNSIDCKCYDPQSSIEFEDVSCTSRNSLVPNFTGSPQQYRVDANFDLTFSAYLLPANSFNVFQFINFLSLTQTLSASSVRQQWQTNAFYGPTINAFRVANLGGVIPPPSSLRAVGGTINALQFENCRETINLGSRVFDGFPILQYLLIKDTPISQIDDHAFDGLETSLREVSLQNAQLKSSPLNALRPLQDLYRIDLTGSGIPSFGSDDFSSFSQLVFLILDGNNIQSAIDSGALNRLPTTLATLFLGSSNPALTKIPASVIQNSPHVTILSLVGNQISSVRIGDIPQNNNVISLDLSKNPITSIQAGALSYLSKTSTLVMSNIKMTSVDFSIFQGMGSLIRIQLDGTQSLRSITVSNLNTVSCSAYSCSSH